MAQDSGLTDAVQADYEARMEALRFMGEALDHEEVDLIVNHLQLEFAKLNRQCNAILTHQAGIPESAIDALQAIKLHIAILQRALRRASESNAKKA